MKKVKVKFFGAFRKYIPQGESDIDIGTDVNAKEFKRILLNYLETNVQGFVERTLVEESAIANEDRILTDTDMIDGRTLVAILPPVCGG